MLKSARGFLLRCTLHPEHFTHLNLKHVKSKHSVDDLTTGIKEAETNEDSEYYSFFPSMWKVFTA